VQILVKNKEEKNSMASAISNQFSAMEKDRIEDDISDEEILEAIKNSMRDLQVSPETVAMTSTNSPVRPKSGKSMSKSEKSGLTSVANVIHQKDEDLAELSEDEQFKLAMRASKIDALSPEEQFELAMKESLALAPQPKEPEVDDDISKALKLSMDPSQQENIEYRDHFQRLTSKNEETTLPDLDFEVPPELREEISQQIAQTEMVRGAEALPLPEEFRVPGLEDLEVENNLRSRSVTKSKIKQPKNPPQTMSKRIAAKFPPKNDNFVNEDLEKAQVEQAIKASLAEIKTQYDPRSLSLSPTTSGSTLNGYSKVTATLNQGRSMTPPNLQRKTPSLPYKQSRKGKFRPVVIDGSNIGWLYANNDRFSAEGIKAAYDCFIRKGYEYKDIHIILRHVPDKFLCDNDRQIIQHLQDIGCLKMAPGRFAGSELIRSDDDLYILQVAKELEGIVLSNDQYKKEFKLHETYRDVIKNRLLQPRFFNEKLILQPDPLGPGGPTLEEFLRFDKD